MLASKYRFHRRNHVNRVYKQGRSVRGEAISLKYRLDPADSDIRIAVVVSKKVAKSAVSRNRIRRRVFEVIREQVETLPPGFEGVFGVFDSSVAEQPIEQLKATIKGMVTKAT